MPGTFLPWAEDNLRPNSVHAYKKLWDGVLKLRRLHEPDDVMGIGSQLLLKSEPCR
jgi:hypothetical protein